MDDAPHPCPLCEMPLERIPESTMDFLNGFIWGHPKSTCPLRHVELEAHEIAAWNARPAVTRMKVPEGVRQAPAPGTKLWLWKNFVDGKREYWAFDSLYPQDENGDPLTLGEPAGYALVKSNQQRAKDAK